MNSPPHLYLTGPMILHTGNIAKLNAYNCHYTDGFIRAYFLFVSMLMETVGTEVAAF